jgi:hypothetical protein
MNILIIMNFNLSSKFQEIQFWSILVRLSNNKISNLIKFLTESSKYQLRSKQLDNQILKLIFFHVCDPWQIENPIKSIV